LTFKYVPGKSEVMAHRKTVRHFHEAGHLHELTFSCYRRLLLLTNDVWREKLARCVEAAGKEWALQLVGFVHDVPPKQQHPKLPVIHGLPDGAII
jgi:hypothetical protein